MARFGARNRLAVLVGQLGDRNWEARREAAERMGAILSGTRRCPPTLLAALRDRNELVRVEAVESVEAIGDRRALPALRRTLHDPSRLVRGYAAEAIGALGTARDRLRLARLARVERSLWARGGYYAGLRLLGDAMAVPALVRLLGSRQYRVRCATAHRLARVARRSELPGVVAALRRALREETTVAGRSALRAGVRALGRRVGGRA